MQLTWLGSVYEVDLDGRDNAPLRGARVAVWAPGRYTFGDLTVERPHWIADFLPRGHGRFLEAHGDSAQDALNALAKLIGGQPLVRGGSC